jgi:hypothetical protein
MWINRDVDLPQALVAAQREGRLVDVEELPVPFLRRISSRAGTSTSPTASMIRESPAALAGSRAGM